jgi:hypothetical protein
MVRKKKHDDDESDPVAEDVTGGDPPEPKSATAPDPAPAVEPDLPPPEPAASVAADPEQPPPEPAEQPDKETGPVEVQVYKESTRKSGPKLYTLQVSRNGSEWADVAHSTVATHADQRDLQQAAIGYTKAQAGQVQEDWVRAGYDVRLIEVGKEPEPEPEPEPAAED